jgi:hypothetical protein
VTSGISGFLVFNVDSDVPEFYRLEGTVIEAGLQNFAA